MVTQNVEAGKTCHICSQHGLQLHLLPCNKVVPSEDIQRPLVGIMGHNEDGLPTRNQQAGNTEHQLWARSTKLVSGVKHD